MKQTPRVHRTPDGLRVEFAARQASLNRLLDRFEEFGRARRIPVAVQRETHLALDEIVSNIIRHGAGGTRSCRISVDVTLDRGRLTIEVVDNGRSFNPVAARPETRTPALKRPSGGLGIRLVKALMDRVEYRRRNGRNHLLMKRGAKSRHQ